MKILSTCKLNTNGDYLFTNYILVATCKLGIKLLNSIQSIKNKYF